jgi:hypothetical protein
MGAVTHDVAFLVAFTLLAVAIPLGCLLFEPQGYSRWLAGVLVLAVMAMAWLHACTDAAVVTTRLHYSTLAVGFKLWFSLNYPRFGRTARIAVHGLAHASLAFIVVAGYSLKAAHPLVVFLIYPLSSLSVALVAESVELKLTQPRRGAQTAPMRVRA